MIIVPTFPWKTVIISKVNCLLQKKEIPDHSFTNSEKSRLVAVIVILISNQATYSKAEKLAGNNSKISHQIRREMVRNARENRGFCFIISWPEMTKSVLGIWPEQTTVDSILCYRMQGWSVVINVWSKYLVVGIFLQWWINFEF